MTAEKKSLIAPGRGPLIEKFCFGEISPRVFFKDENWRLPLVRLAVSLYGKEKRKVSSDPYFKHPLRCLVLLGSIENNFQSNDFSSDDWLVAEAVVLLHDVLEIKRKNGESYSRENLLGDLARIDIINENLRERIVRLVEILTPEPKAKNLSTEDWKEVKRQDMKRIFRSEVNDKDKIILFLVKSADILANMEETLVDWQDGKEDGKMRLLSERIAVFKERIGYLTNIFSENPFNKKLNQTLLALEKAIS